LVPEQVRSFHDLRWRRGALGTLDRLGHVPGGGSPTASVPTRTEKGQVTEYDPDSTETDRELE